MFPRRTVSVCTIIIIYCINNRIGCVADKEPEEQDICAVLSFLRRDKFGGYVQNIQRIKTFTHKFFHPHMIIENLVKLH